MTKQPTVTGGRPAGGGVIPGRWALSVGKPDRSTPAGFEWIELQSIARLESGHTPSRRHPEYWGDGIPWVGIRDATANHGRIIRSTRESVSAAGIENSSARVLPAGTVCLSRTASVGYVVMMGVPMATSQDFVNWVCSPRILPRYLMWLLEAEQESVRRFSHGTTHQTMYYPEAKALHVCIPDVPTQRTIAGVLGALDDLIDTDQQLIARVRQLSASWFAALATRAIETIELREVARVNPAQIKPQPEGELTYLDIASIGDGTIALPEPSPWASAPSRARRLASHGDTLWSTVRPNRRAHAMLLEPPENLVVSTGLAVLHPTSAGPATLFAATDRQEFVDFLVSRAEGSAYPAVRGQAFLDAPLPDVFGESEDFESTMWVLWQWAGSLASEAALLRRTRDELLPLLMSGAVTVREVVA